MRYIPGKPPGPVPLTRPQRRLRLWGLLIIFLLAVFARLDFVANRLQVPYRYGDQHGYWLLAELFADGLRLAAPVFGEVSNDSKEWLANAQIALPTALLRDSAARRGILPLLYVPAMFTPFPVAAVQITQALLFATLPLAIFLIVRRVTRPELAWIAALVGALYPPLIIATGRFLQQGPAALMLTWGIACLLYARPKGANHRLVYTGYFLLTLTGYTVLTARPVVLLIMLFWPTDENHRARRAKRRYLLVLAAFLVLWSLVLAVLDGQSILNTLAKTSTGISGDNLQNSIDPINFGSFVDTELWRTDDTFSPQVGLPERQSLLDLFTGDPVAAVRSVLVNAHRFLLEPYNAFGQPYLLDYAGQRIIHQLLLALATLGLLSALARPRNGLGALAWIVIVLLGSLVVIYSVIHIESRYLSLLTPAQIVLAMAGIHWLWAQCRSAARRMAVGGALASVWIANLAITTPALLNLFPATSPITAHTIDALLSGAGWLATAGIILWAAGSETKCPQRWLTILAGASIAVLATGGMIAEPTWRAWQIALVPGDSVQQHVDLSNAAPPPGTMPYLLIDLGSLAGETSISARIDGGTARALAAWYTSNRGANSGYDPFLAANGGGLEAFRHWRFVPLDEAPINEGETITIELTNTGNAPVTLWGDYADDPAVFTGPSFSPWDDSRSVFRLYWGKSDRRVTVENPLHGAIYSSAPAEIGRYRIYIVWIEEDTAPPHPAQ